MPTLELSSNWKKLQRTLKKTDGAQTGQKRKRGSETTHTSKLDGASSRARKPTTQQRHFRKRTMGSSYSQVADTLPEPSPTSHNSYKPPLPSNDSTDPSTLINQGLHPTHKPGKYLALDCEMVGTGPPPSLEHVLARVSIVNYHGQQIYDSYVEPRAGEVVTDYRTHVSGIRAADLRAGYARPFADVQAQVADLLQGKVLVGHALRNDEKTLLLSHPRRDVRDTARYPGYRKLAGGKTPGLRKLAKQVLGVEIQTGEHSSVEDAGAAMELFRREREGFEREVRIRYGAAPVRKGEKTLGGEKDRAVNGNGSRAVAVVESSLDGEDEDEDESNDTELEGEDGGLEDLDGGSATSPQKSKKKRKKKHKKRTKRA